MRRKLVSLLVGSQWRTFCGFSEVRFRSFATTTLDSLDYEYTVEERNDRFDGLECCLACLVIAKVVSNGAEQKVVLIKLNAPFLLK